MDLPDELNLDEDGKDEEGGEGDGMFSIQASPLTELILPFKTLGLVIFCNAFESLLCLKQNKKSY